MDEAPPLRDDPQAWLRWASRVRAIAQTGLAYAADPYDRERYAELQALATACLAHLTGRPIEAMVALFADEAGYPTPKVDVRAVAFDGDRLLLVRERREGRWSLPGGWADVGYSAGEVAVKEVFEESGYHVVPRKILALLDRAKHPHPLSIHQVYKVFLLCELLGGAPTTSIETDAVGFFGRDELPPLSIDRVTPQQIARMFYHHDHPDSAADFD